LLRKGQFNKLELAFSLKQLQREKDDVFEMMEVSKKNKILQITFESPFKNMLQYVCALISG